MNGSTLKSCVAIGAIVILESIALLKGINGVAFASALAAIAGLGGFVVGRGLIKRK